MSPVFLLGVRLLWDELQHMPVGGLWLVNTDSAEVALALANNTIAAQSANAKVAVITAGNAPRSLIMLPAIGGPDKVRLFNMPGDQKVLSYITDDLTCNIAPENYLIIIVNDENMWGNIPGDNLKLWLKNTSNWAKEQQCTVLVINPGSGIDHTTSAAISEYQSLAGLASLRDRGDSYGFDIAWWSNERGVSARQLLDVELKDGQLSLLNSEVVAPQPRSDEKQILSHVAFLEGAPPLSEHWVLFDNNGTVLDAARSAQAATIIFIVTKSNLVEELARHIYTLRRTRGSALKIIVREKVACLRATDERLLLGCGANLIIPWNTPLSRSLSLIESVQNQAFSRHIPDDVEILIRAMKPMELKGFQPFDKFYQAITELLNNPLIPENSRGVLVSLRPVPGLRSEQALTLCRPNRLGDIVTLGEDKLVLFLLFCRINDLDTALGHIFPLPVADLVSNRIVWFEDNQIAAELNNMKQLKPGQRSQPLPHMAESTDKPANVTYDQRGWRRVPTPVTLLASTNKEAEHHGLD